MALFTDEKTAPEIPLAWQWLSQSLWHLPFLIKKKNQPVYGGIIYIQKSTPVINVQLDESSQFIIFL